MKEIETMEDYETARKSAKIVLIDFYTQWCNPCKMLKPVLEEIEKEKEYDDIKFYRLDCDNFSDLADEMKINSIPAIVFFKDGEINGEHIIGNKPKDRYTERIEELMTMLNLR